MTPSPSAGGQIPLVLFGSGGHASDVLASIEAINAHAPTFAVLGAIDDDQHAAGHRLRARGVDLLPSLPEGAQVTIAIGYPAPKMRVAARLSGVAFATVVDPSATIGAGVEIGAGAQVLTGAHLSPLAVVGRHVLVSYRACIGHDVVLGDGTSVMPAAIVSGDVRVGAGVTIGTNATILEGVTIGDGATVGAGAVVTGDVAPGVTVVGVPAR